MDEETRKLIGDTYGSLVSIWNTSTDPQSAGTAAAAAKRLKPILFNRKPQ